MLQTYSPIHTDNQASTCLKYWSYITVVQCMSQLFQNMRNLHSAHNYVRVLCSS